MKKRFNPQFQLKDTGEIYDLDIVLLCLACGKDNPDGLWWEDDGDGHYKHCDRCQSTWEADKQAAEDSTKRLKEEITQ